MGRVNIVFFLFTVILTGSSSSSVYSSPYQPPSPVSHHKSPLPLFPSYNPPYNFPKPPLDNSLQPPPSSYLPILKLAGEGIVHPQKGGKGGRPKAPPRKSPRAHESSPPPPTRQRSPPPPTRQRSPPPPGAGLLDYYILALQWPASVCLLEMCFPHVGNTKRPNEFKIHGFWPEKNVGEVVKTKKTFGVDTLKDDKVLLDRMEQNWPDIKIFGNVNAYYGFWIQEWSNHGCATIDPQNEYLKKALDANDLVKDVIANARLLQRFRPGRDINATLLAEQFPRKSFPSCKVDRKTGKEILAELHFTISQNGYRIIDADTTKKSGRACPNKNVLLPSI